MLRLQGDAIEKMLSCRYYCHVLTKLIKADRNILYAAVTCIHEPCLLLKGPKLLLYMYLNQIALQIVPYLLASSLEAFSHKNSPAQLECQNHIEPQYHPSTNQVSSTLFNCPLLSIAMIWNDAYCTWNSK